MSESKYQQFLQLLPATLAVAGLPTADHGKYVTEEQMEMRARAVRNAFKQVVAMVKELTETPAQG
jgi:hypothetical protein